MGLKEEYSDPPNYVEIVARKKGRKGKKRKRKVRRKFIMADDLVTNLVSLN